MKNIEIEKKYIVKKLPKDLDKYENKKIEQSYLNKGGEPIRIRKYINNDNIYCVFSKKVRCGCDNLKCMETNIELPLNVYEALLSAKEGRTIYKTRYIIPLENGLKVELDLFDDFFKGVCVAEIEFNSEEQANSFVIPEWLKEFESKPKELTNCYMAIEATDINEYEKYMLR